MRSFCFAFLFGLYLCYVWQIETESLAKEFHPGWRLFSASFYLFVFWPFLVFGCLGGFFRRVSGLGV